MPGKYMVVSNSISEWVASQVWFMLEFCQHLYLVDREGVEEQTASFPDDCAGKRVIFFCYTEWPFCLPHFFFLSQCGLFTYLA